MRKMLQKLLLCMFLSLILNEISFCVERGCYGTDEVCKKCKCSKENTVVECGHLQLTEIPYPLPRNLSKLLLYKNSIGSIQRKSLKKCSNLQYLDLEKNKLSELPLNIFRGVPLQYLNLYRNKLSLSTEVFLPLGQTLIELNIRCNCNITQRVFNNLHKLEKLSIDGHLTYGGFGESFSTLKSLQWLLIGKPLNKLSNSTFSNFQNTSLKNLTLAGAGINEIESEAFRPLKELRNLDLSYSSGLKFTNVTHSLHSLSDGLEELSLMNIYGTYNPDVELGEEFFKELSKKNNLKKLRLGGNSLNKISSKMFIYTRSLEHLDISHNHLQYSDDWLFYVALLVNMTFANFGEQVRDGLDRAHAENDPVINFSEKNCKAKDLKDILPCTFEKTNLKPWCLLCPRNLKELRLSRSTNYALCIPPILIFGNCKISQYFYRDNGLKKAFGPIVLLQPASDDPASLDFGDNNMRCLSPEFLKLSIERGLRVGRLILDGNNLSEQLEHDKRGDTFATYSQLTELNLANNKLRVLNKLTFYNLTKLEILILSSNSLQTLDFDILRLKELKVLDLTDNRFTTFEPGSMLAFSSLSQAKGYGWLTLYINRNTFTCSCDSIHFINWIIENKTKIDKFDKVTCKHKDSFLRLDELYDMAYDIKLSCYYELPMTISGTILALMIICTVIGTISYKYRWDIRYYLIAHSQKKRQYQLHLDQENNYLYDAFVSYDMDDRSWIVKELISNIEQISPIVHLKLSPTQHNTSKGIGNEKDLLKNVKNENYGSLADGPSGINTSLESITNEDVASSAECDDDVTFRLCIHERDFELGNGIEENILNAIQRSRMVILIVSSHFIESKWCRLEMELAKMECLERGRNIVVTILLEPIQETLKSLEWFMKKYTYHEWFKCDTKSKKDEFWKRLKLALRGENR